MDAISEFTKYILMSVRPEYASKIFEGKKTVELRRRFPEARTAGGTAIIYSSAPVRAIIGRVQIKRVFHLPLSAIWTQYGKAACITRSDFDDYFSGLKFGFAILLDEAATLATPISAQSLKTQFGVVPPQSYRYLDPGLAALLGHVEFQTTHRHKHSNRPRGRAASSSLSR